MFYPEMLTVRKEPVVMDRSDSGKWGLSDIWVW